MTVIVGAGLAGLACATRLEQEEAEWMILEVNEKPGGRVATEITEEGYHLDAGFQVLLDSYPAARRVIDIPALNPRYFQSGALLADDKSGWERLLNPIAHPEGLLPALTSKTFSWSEKVSFALHCARQLVTSDESILSHESGYSMAEELRRLGLDGELLGRFLRPFFGGVFLDEQLRADASLFRYDLKKFALGKALIPAGGMGKIPEQLASRLPQGRQRYGTRVAALRRDADRITGVELEGGECVPCSKLVLASDERATRQLLGLPPGDSWIGVTTLYFTGERPLYSGALLVLPHRSEERHHLVTHFVDLTNIAPEYAPSGRRLLSATVLHQEDGSVRGADPLLENAPSLEARVQAEISVLLPEFAHWQFLRQVRIPRALPQRGPSYTKRLLPVRLAPNLFLAGDQITYTGIEAALVSGLETAEAILRRT